MAVIRFVAIALLTAFLIIIGPIGWIILVLLFGGFGAKQAVNVHIYNDRNYTPRRRRPRIAPMKPVDFDIEEIE